MTLFLNKGVFFTSVFDRNQKKRSDVQLGKISKAVQTLNVINQDISISIDKDNIKIDKLNSRIMEKAETRSGNNALLTKLNEIL
jgi:hypothetical protein